MKTSQKYSISSAYYGDAVPKRPTPLLHPQSLVVTLLWRLSDFFSVSSCTCGLPYRDTYNKQGKADRCRRGTQSQTRTNRTRCRAAGFPATSSQQNDPDGTMYNPSTATNLITLYWWHLFYDYNSSPRQIRLTGKRAAICPRRQNWPWPLAHWCRICPYANQCLWHPQAQLQNFPHIRPLVPMTSRMEPLPISTQ